MPQTAPSQTTHTAQGAPASGSTSPSHEPPVLPILLLLVLLCAMAWLWKRWKVRRAWQAYARKIQGELRMRRRLFPACLAATFRNRPFLLEITVSHEDDAPYHHTRGALPLGNPSSFILGLRHKSLLEEMQTRRESPPFDLGDPQFEKRFFVVCNNPDALPQVLTKEACRELSRYPDVEVYVRLHEIEWRRSGEVSDIRTIERLNNLIADMAEAIDALPPSDVPLSLRLADEQRIAKGV